MTIGRRSRRTSSTPTRQPPMSGSRVRRPRRMCTPAQRARRRRRGEKRMKMTEFHSFDEGRNFVNAGGLPATVSFLLSTRAVADFTAKDTLEGGVGEITAPATSGSRRSRRVGGRHGSPRRLWRTSAGSSGKRFRSGLAVGCSLHRAGPTSPYGSSEVKSRSGPGTFAMAAFRATCPDTYKTQTSIRPSKSSTPPLKAGAAA